VPLGASFGPIVAGPEGATCWELSFGDFGGWGDHPEEYDAEIAARGVTPLPDPPLTMPAWWVDPRGQWGGSAERTWKIDGVEPTVMHMDELTWTDVKHQRNPDGALAVIREKWPISRPDFMTAYMEYSPGMVCRRHGHFGHHLVFVIAGGAWFGERWCPAGTHIELPFGAAFGPIVAGDEGTVFLEITNGDFRSWGDQPELFDAIVTERGIVPLPDPEITTIGDWFEDKRGFWSPDAD
jgi:hypothetical protein